MNERLREIITNQGEIPDRKELRHIKHNSRLENLIADKDTPLAQSRAFWDLLILALGSASFWQLGKEKIAAEHERKVREFAENKRLQEERSESLRMQNDLSEHTEERQITVADLIPDTGNASHRVAKIREMEHRYGSTLRSGSATERVAAMRQIRHGR